MPSSQEIISVIIGAVKVAQRDQTALNHFDLSADGFWRSFTAILYALPFYFIFITASWRMGQEADVTLASSLTTYATSELLTYGVMWVLYPLAIAGITRATNLTQSFAPYVIVYNWSSLLIAALMVLPYIFFSLGLIGVGGASLIILFLFILALVYRWILASQILRANPLIASGVVALDVGLSILLAQLTQAFRGVEAL
ncbi:MAG: hypothetical protein RLN89_08015 [Parvibaculum sp.]